MAIAIQNTPILTGDDATKFRQSLKDQFCKILTPEEEQAKQETLDRMKKNYDLMRSISNDSFY